MEARKCALVTGASSGIGRDMAVLLSKMGYDLIVASRNTRKLEELRRELVTDARIVSLDLSDERACYDLFEQAKDRDVEILINNAGYGLVGDFCDTDMETELNMIDLNVRSVYILSKLFLREFMGRDAGFILNVASAAAFLPGPAMACYYATKAFVLRLSQSVSAELKMSKSRVYMGALCPGPVETGFNERAGAGFGVKGLPSRAVAGYALKQMFRRKSVIIPGAHIRAGVFLAGLMPSWALERAVYRFQKGKKG